MVRVGTSFELAKDRETEINNKGPAGLAKSTPGPTLALLTVAAGKR